MKTPKGTRLGGRQKGTPNRITTDVRTAIQEAFIEAGGVNYLKGIAKSDPAVFCRLLGMTLPKDVHLTGALSLMDLLVTADSPIADIPSEVTH